MSEQEIKQKLDQLADFQARRTLLDMDKRALLDDVKVPEEVQAIVAAGMKKVVEVESQLSPLCQAVNADKNEQLAAIVIPDEIKAALALIDVKRQLVNKNADIRMEEINKQILAKRTEIRASVEAQTRDVYTALNQRKAEIEAEFAGKAEAVDENIEKLTAEIKSDIKAFGASVKSEYYHGVYVKGRVTWNTDMLDGLITVIPQLEKARKVGDPSVTLRKI